MYKGINMDQLFLLGAGFNKDVRKLVGTITGNSINDGEYEIEVEYPLLTDIQQKCFPNISIDKIEEAFSDSVKKNEFEPLKILYNELIGKADYYFIPELRKRNNIYKDFIKKFQNSQFLTFNYDCLVESLLFNLKKWYPHDGYGLNLQVEINELLTSDDSADVDEIFKPMQEDLKTNSKKLSSDYLLKQKTKNLVIHLHGSFYIYSCEAYLSPTSTTNNVIESELKLMEPEYYFDPDVVTMHFYPYGRVRPNEGYELPEKRVIAPIPDKAAKLNQPFITEMYKKAKQLIADNIIAIGYDFNKNDEGSYKPLLERLTQNNGYLYIICPNANKVAKRLQQQFSKITICAINSTFSEWGYNGFELNG
jgi:hypothetical protein